MSGKPSPSLSIVGARTHKSCDACKSRKVRCPSMFISDLSIPGGWANHPSRLWTARALRQLHDRKTRDYILHRLGPSSENKIGLTPISDHLQSLASFYQQTTLRTRGPPASQMRKRY
ncbi:C6 zinc finger protein [Colletotrichum tofieldiae]|nr:C6 zinc finger protein [Colletotrichum tofieldiae]GKT74869.1 C6 zinc finger protein [Colletotrichum tofieldiae]